MSDYRVVNPATGAVESEFETATDAEIAAAHRARRRGVPRLGPDDARRARRRPAPGRGPLRRAASTSSPRSSPARWARPPPRRSARSSTSPTSTATTPTTARRCWPTSRSPSATGGSAIVRKAPIGAAARDHAVELPVLPGRPVRRPEPDGGQHDPAQARAAVPRVGARDGADLPRRRAAAGRLHQPVRHQRAGRRHDRRPAGGRRLGDRQRAGRHGRRRDRRRATSRRSCSSSAARTRSSCSTPTTSPSVGQGRRRGRMENAGQACNAAKRFIVADRLYDEFVDAVHRGDGRAGRPATRPTERRRTARCRPRRRRPA